MSQGPFMLYAGQELGEPAVDAEGYSGNDGRTTIFDYWSVPTVRRWHQGHPTAAERRLRALYRKILRLCNSEPTLACGQFFDLMYVNQDRLDTSRHYAYLRHCDGEMTVVVANFGDTAIDSSIRIPQHALDCAQMPHGSYHCMNLLTEEPQTVALTTDTTLPVHIDAHSAILLKVYKSNKQ
jgi:hypothetical protein